jgi:hypothetical protein
LSSQILNYQQQISSANQYISIILPYSHREGYTGCNQEAFLSDFAWIYFLLKKCFFERALKGINLSKFHQRFKSLIDIIIRWSILNFDNTNTVFTHSRYFYIPKGRHIIVIALTVWLVILSVLHFQNRWGNTVKFHRIDLSAILSCAYCGQSYN